MKQKSFWFALSLVAIFFLADSRFNIIFFKEKLSINAIIYCSVLNEINGLRSAIESEDPKTIILGTKKLQSRLGFAYSAETGFSGFGDNSKQADESKLAASLNTAKKEFTRLGNLKESEIPGKISEIEKVTKETENLLKPYC